MPALLRRRDEANAFVGLITSAPCEKARRPRRVLQASCASDVPCDIVRAATPVLQRAPARGGEIDKFKADPRRCWCARCSRCAAHGSRGERRGGCAITCRLHAAQPPDRAGPSAGLPIGYRYPSPNATPTTAAKQRWKISPSGWPSPSYRRRRRRCRGQAAARHDQTRPRVNGVAIGAARQPLVECSAAVRLGPLGRVAAASISKPVHRAWPFGQCRVPAARGDGAFVSATRCRSGRERQARPTRCCPRSSAAACRRQAPVDASIPSSRTPLYKVAVGAWLLRPP